MKLKKPISWISALLIISGICFIIYPEFADYPIQKGNVLESFCFSMDIMSKVIFQYMIGFGLCFIGILLFLLNRLVQFYRSHKEDSDEKYEFHKLKKQDLIVIIEGKLNRNALAVVSTLVLLTLFWNINYSGSYDIGLVNMTPFFIGIRIMLMLLASLIIDKVVWAKYIHNLLHIAVLIGLLISTALSAMSSWICLPLIVFCFINYFVLADLVNSKLIKSYLLQTSKL